MKERLKYDENIFFVDLFDSDVPVILSEEDKEYLLKYERHRKVFSQEIRNNLVSNDIEYKNGKNFSIALYYESEPGTDELYHFITSIVKDFELDVCDVNIDESEPILLSLYPAIDVLVNLSLNKFNIKEDYDAIKVFYNNRDQRTQVFSYYF